MKEEKIDITRFNTRVIQDSVTNSVVVWNFEIVLLLKFVHYTDNYTGRVERVANRVLI